MLNQLNLSPNLVETPSPEAELPASVPTCSSEVTRDTPIESLNLNWKERDLPEKERTKHVHRLHPYLGKFIPQLVEIFLRKFFEPGQTVADPFGGSGTTLVEATQLGIHSVAYDISAFNVLLMRAKTMPVDVGVFKREVADILNSTLGSANNAEAVIPGLFEENAVESCASEYLMQWYAPKALAELLSFRDNIRRGKFRYAELLQVILSRAARSARLTEHFDLDFPKRPCTQPYYCYKHSRTCQPTDSAIKFLQRYAIDTVMRVEVFQRLRTAASVRVEHNDSRAALIPRIDGVITSPPYVGLIDYHEQHNYAYHLLGLRDRRTDEIGPATGGSGASARAKYQEEIAVVLARFLDKMPPGGPMIVVAGDRHGLYPEVAKRLGVDEVGVVQRHVNRRTGRRSSEFYESIFIWRKR